MTYPEPPLAGDEIDTLLGSLERQRATLAWKCGGLDAAGIRTRLRPSAITPGGLLKHLAACEDHKFTHMLHGRDHHEPFASADWKTHPDWDWLVADDDTPEGLVALWETCVARSRLQITEAITAGGLEFATVYTTPSGRRPSLRRLLIDMIEEYARHTGHADLIRESIDGVVGEDPPGGAYAFSRV
ncbi:DinB family protein [Hamadaea tsunoensis]|uniref:DinB family protein n=1 Tax=Hamadaea tsunoensis TaxID=53368 RepID=UPI000412F948|nr:DinB family protein [Hamadaea tsunoensis]